MVQGLRIVTILGLALGTMVSCAKKPVDKAAMVGIYKSTSNPLLNNRIPYVIITADQSLYTLQIDQTTFRRAYRGNTGDMKFDFENNKFSSGDFEAEKLSGTEADLPELLKTLDSLNKASLALLNELNKEGIKLELRLEQTNPKHVQFQKQVVDKLIEKRDVLVKYMKDKKLEAFWITDYTNDSIYIKDKHLNLPAGIDSTKTTPDTIVEALATDATITTY